MGRGALRRPDGGGRSERLLFVRLGRRAIAADMAPVNDNRPAGADRLRRLLAPVVLAARLARRLAGRR